MSANWFTTGNEKLHFACLMLEQLAAPVSDRAGDLRLPVWRQACLEAAAFHLRAAQMAYLAEISVAHELGEAPVESLASLLQRARSADCDSETLRELENLAASPDAWWARFELAWQALWQARPESLRTAADSPDRVTIASDAGSAPAYLAADVVQEAADCLRELRERQRNAMQEW